MELTVLNPSFEKIYILDTYESLIWVDKFNEPGTFEIYTPVTDDILTYLVKDNYLINPDSEHVMIIEDFSLESDSESGDHIKIIGRSLESILDRRIVWKDTSFKEKHNLQKAIQKLITRAMINPEGTSSDKANRTIANFRFLEETSDTTITSLKLEDGAQYQGQTLLEIIQGLCTDKKIGFKITLSDSYEFVFTLYNGVDRSYRQTINPYVVFRPSFDNVINSNYKEENSKVKTFAYVVGEGEVGSRKEELVGDSSLKGINRRELFVDASNISQTVRQEDDAETKSIIDDTQYLKLLKQRGEKELAQIKKDIKSFDGKCETTRLYRYGRDFFMGDIVQMANEYGMEASSRITEFTWNYSTSEIETYPTFTAVEEEENS